MCCVAKVIEVDHGSPAGPELRYPPVGQLMRSSLGLTFSSLVLMALSCGVHDNGLAPTADAGGSAGTVACGASLVDKGNWPANTSYTECSQTCGPDDLGLRTCSQNAQAACRASGGCVCIDSLCAACGACTFHSLPACYQPTNAASAAQVPACDKTIKKGGSCSAVCNRELCMQDDGKTACLCNNVGKYACATWGETTWK